MANRTFNSHVKFDTKTGKRVIFVPVGGPGSPYESTTFGVVQKLLTDEFIKKGGKGVKTTTTMRFANINIQPSVQNYQNSHFNIPTVILL